MRAAIVCVLLGGCLLKPDPPGGCVHWGTWGPIESGMFDAHVNTTQDEWGAWLSPDKLELFYSTFDNMGGATIYRAHRSSNDVPFEAGENVTVSPGPTGDSDPFLSDDGLTMWYGTSAASDLDLVVATRASRAGTMFDMGAKVSDVNTTRVEIDADLTSDGSLMFFTSDRGSPGNGNDIYVARRSATRWNAPVPIHGLDTIADESSPTVSRDGSELIVGVDKTVHDFRGDPATFAYTDLGAIPGTDDGREWGDPQLTRDGTILVLMLQRASRDLVFTQRRCED